MKNNKLIEIRKEKELSFYFSIIGSILISILNMVNTFVSFSFLILNYTLVSFMFAFTKIVIRFTKKENIIFLIGTFSLILIIVPLATSMVLTIIEKDNPQYLFDWMIYAYAFYGTIKIIIAIKSISKKNKSNKEMVLSIFSMISALFTIQLIEFALISTFGNEDNLLSIQYLYQGFVIFIAIFCIISLTHKQVKLSKYQINS